jgi:hypothetical protein
MIWGGIDQQLSKVADKPGVSDYQQNTRMVVTGELQRRPGMAPANFSPTGGSALGMVGAFPTSGPYGCVVDATGSVSGFPITGPIWEPPKLKPPILQGNAWNIFGSASVGFSDGNQFGVVATGTQPTQCGGSITITLSTLTAGQCTITAGRGRFPFEQFIIVDSRVFVTNNMPYVVAIPGSVALPYVNVVLTFAGAGGVDYTVSGASTPGCG